MPNAEAMPLSCGQFITDHFKWLINHLNGTKDSFHNVREMKNKALVNNLTKFKLFPLNYILITYEQLKLWGKVRGVGALMKDGNYTLFYYEFMFLF